MLSMSRCKKHGICKHESRLVCSECAAENSGTQPTSTNTASFQLPLTMESCIEHLRAIWGDIHITAEVRCAVEETHDFIERQLQTLL